MRALAANDGCLHHVLAPADCSAPASPACSSASSAGVVGKACYPASPTSSAEGPKKQASPLVAQQELLITQAT